MAMIALVSLGGCQYFDSGNAQIVKSLREAAQLSQQSNDFSAAVGYYRNLYERDPKDFEAALGLVRGLRFAGQPDQAIAIANEALHKRPREPAPLLAERGKAEVAAGLIDAAADSLQRALALDPGNWQAHSALGVVEDRRGRHEAAQRAYRAALALAPNSVAAVNNLALSLALGGDIESAISELERLNAAARSTPQMRQNLALLYALNGNLKQAETLARGDLPPDVADHNIAFYRLLAGQRGP
ncbi:MAG: tetratricopeptide repeat protein [Pseudomonadota bacterium]